jgi:hypothetical protein
MTDLDPRIGILNSGKFYCFDRGHDQRETVGTRAECERALGLRTDLPADPAPAAKVARCYVVTITPRAVVYAGSWSSGPYQVEVIAATAAEAIRRARRDYRAENGGRFDVPADFRARRGA